MSAKQQDGATGLGEALAAPVDPTGDPGPGERSGLSSRIAEDILSGTGDVGAEEFGADFYGAPESGAPADDAAPIDLRAVEIDDPARAVGDDPAHPIHGSMAQEFETR